MRRRGQRGQALPLVALLGAALLVGGLGVFWLGRAQAARARAQVAADLTAVSAGRRLQAVLPAIAADPDTARDAWRSQVRAEAARIARANGARLTRLTWPDAPRWPPAVVQVTVQVAGPSGLSLPATARAALTPGAGGLPEAWSAGGSGQYAGPLVMRDGKPMCPAVAAAFDRMDAAARGDGVDLVVVSGFRSDAEQAVLFRRHPDPRWVAPPGRSRHRDATELDLGGRGAWPWLAEHAATFGFAQRYSWEPWHFGYLPGCGSPRPVTRDALGGGRELPRWVPVDYRALVARSAADGGVPAIVLAALLRAESEYDPRAVSPAGALGIAQFMPATAAGMGLRNPFDPAQAIPAAGRLLGGHLRRFGSIPLALAAYNAGPGAVARYGGIPPYAETQGYVARIMALAGDPTMVGAGGGGVRLVRADGLLV